MSELWAEVAWLPGGPAHRVTIDQVDGVITDVRTGTDPAPGATRLGGLALPGLANAHSHAFHRALRGRFYGDGGTFWTWREAMYAVADRLDPTSYYALARAVFGEMVEAGFTAVGEFHYLHHGAGGMPYDDPNVMGAAVMAAAREVGIRLTLLDTCYLHGGFAADGSYAALDPAQQRFGDATAEAWASRVDGLRTGPRSRIGAAIHSVRAVDPSAMRVVADWSRAAGVPLHAHVSEQPSENDQTMAAHGRSPTEMFAQSDALGPSFTAIHATHPSEHDIQLLAESGASVCLCPTTERDLADGIGPSQAFVAAGIRQCIGSDAHTIVDPFEEMRGVEMHARLATGKRGVHSAQDLVAIGSDGGYQAIGWPEGGAIAVGKLADFVVVGAGSSRLVGVDPTAVPLVATAADVVTVIVAGETVVHHGAHTRIDVAAELSKVLG